MVCCVRGYHVYQEVWRAAVGEDLAYVTERPVTSEIATLLLSRKARDSGTRVLKKAGKDAGEKAGKKAGKKTPKCSAKAGNSSKRTRNACVYKTYVKITC